MTLTVTVRLPRCPLAPGTARGSLGAALAVTEPAALLIAEAAGAGLAGRIACAVALRAARRALGS